MDKDSSIQMLLDRGGSNMIRKTKRKVNLLDIRVNPMIMGRHPIEIGTPHLLQTDEEEFEKVFQKIDIIEVADFVRSTKSVTQTPKERRIRRHVRLAEEAKLPDFRRPVLDPSLIDYRWQIIYCQGRQPAIGRTAIWWEQAALSFMPEKNSRLSDEIRNDVFLAFLTKELVEKEKYKKKEAWHAVCVDSKWIGNYYDSQNMGSSDYEQTGKRRMGRFFDLGNTKKILKSSQMSNTYLSAGGSMNHRGRYSPLATVKEIQNPENSCEDGVGVIITDV